VRCGVFVTPIRFVRRAFCVDAAYALRDALDENPQLWNRHGARTKQYVHSRVDDIWVRYNDIKNYGGDLGRFNDAHESVWYPTAAPILDVVRPIVYGVMTEVEGERLGGVLITRVPAGGEVTKHSDHSWHAQYYDKFAVQIAGNGSQAFCFADARLSAEPGDLYTFDNSKVHWVENPSSEDRITLIICIRTRWTQEANNAMGSSSGSSSSRRRNI
jgi:hypothetical protein